VRWLIVIIAFLAAAALDAQSISGTVVVKHKLTRRKVVVDVTSYDRGPVVAAAPEDREDALAFERSRVAVYLEFRNTGRPGTPKTAALEQRNREFVPDSLVIPAGSTVSFPNFDPIFHNVFSLSRAKSFDLGNYPKGHTRNVVFPKPGIVFVNCHLHPNMGATIVVTPGPWGTLADRDGSFSFDNVPPGVYTAVAWHKAAGFFRQTVEVGPGSHPIIQFIIPLNEDGTLSADIAIAGAKSR